RSPLRSIVTARPGWKRCRLSAHKRRRFQMLNISLNLERRKEMEAFVDHCELKTPEEVSRLFLEYTLLIWDYLLVGRIADFYNDDIIMNHAGGVTVQGLESVYSGTL